MGAWQRFRFDLIVIGSALAFLVASGIVVYQVSGDTTGVVLADAARLEFGFEDGEEEDRSPVGWFTGGQEGGYQVRAVQDRVRTGQWAAKISLVAERGYEAFGVFGECVDAAPFTGTRVRFHGFIATDGIDASQAGLWLRADAEDNDYAAFDNMRDRPLTGSADFARHEIVLDIPANAVELCFGALLAGAGTLWGDDFALESVAPLGQGPAVTATLSTTLLNGSFEEGTRPGPRPAQWDIGGEPAYVTSVVDDDTRAGAAVVRIRHVSDMRDDQAGYLQQCIADTSALEGRRVTVTAWTRTQDVTGAVVVRLSAQRLPGEQSDGEVLVDAQTPDPALTGTTPWQRHEIARDIPVGVHSVCVAVEMTGAGILDVDDVSLDVDG